jgi:hypothetical protein
MANQYMKKIFSILGHKGNANQNCIEIPSQPNQNGCHQEEPQMLPRSQEKGNPYYILLLRM